jgi:hypothetical protein
MDLELLLARFDDGRPALSSGLPLKALYGAPRLGRDPLPPSHLFDDGADANSLPAQRWALLVPEGPDGKRLLALIEPLRKVRQEEQGGAPVKIYEAPSQMTVEEAREWVKTKFWGEPIVDKDLPRYVLILGDLHQVPLVLQQAIPSNHYVGRLAFPDDAGYGAYVAKVLRWKRQPAPESKARSLFFSSQDGSVPITIGYRQLVTPAIEGCKEGQLYGNFPEHELAVVDNPLGGGANQLLAAAAMPKPTVLFSLSHGLGGPRGGWDSWERQRRLQGAMSLGDGQRLFADDLKGKTFLPGGIWFFFACFGAGTPSESEYYHWFAKLKEAGQYSALLEDVICSLPRKSEKPFIAALPQTVLANPEGPLAVIGHVDLAWTYGFQDEYTRPHPSRFIRALRYLVRGNRVGLGIGALSNAMAQASVDLAMVSSRMTADEVRRQKAGAPAHTNEADLAQLASLSLVRQDLAQYMLLGDPAVQLPLAPPRVTPSLPTVSREELVLGMPVTTIRQPSGPTPREMENAVLELIRGEVPAKELAGRLGVTQNDLREWEQVYMTAGREALERRASRG